MLHKGRIYVMLLAIVSILSLPLAVSANSAEPPGMTVIVLGAPEDVSLTLRIDTDEQDGVRIRQSRAAWEVYFRFYYHADMEAVENAALWVESSQGSFLCALPGGVDNGYNNLLTLDYSSRTLKMGEPVWRQPLLVAMRVILTLILESAVFCILGFREKRSWIVFMTVNLLTQGWLNLSVCGKGFSGGYWVIGYVFMELCILLGEAVAFPLLVKEKKKYVCVLYALAANLLSLLLGGWMIGNLPV